MTIKDRIQVRINELREKRDAAVEELRQVEQSIGALPKKVDDGRLRVMSLNTRLGELELLSLSEED